MSKILNLFDKAKKKLNNNINEYQNNKDDDLEFSKAKRTKLKLRLIIGGISIVFFGACVVILIMSTLAPMIVMTNVVAGIADGITDFGASVGNLFTTGCYGTTEKCAEDEENTAEKKFKDSLAKVWDMYYKNTEKMFDGNIENDEYNINSNGYARYRYSINLNLPVLVSTIFYAKSPVDGYKQLMYGGNIINELLEKDEVIIADEFLKWYADENDPESINYDKIWSKVTGITIENPCGNYNEIFSDAIKGKYNDIIKYYDSDSKTKNIIDKFLNLFDDKETFSVLRVSAKNSVTKSITSTCSTAIKIDEKTKNKTYTKEIMTRVNFNYDDEEYRNYLINDYLPETLKNKYLKDELNKLLIKDGFKLNTSNTKVINVSGNDLTNDELDSLINKTDYFKTEITKLSNNYNVAISDLEKAADEIISNSEYYYYILDEILNSRKKTIKTCNNLLVETDNKVTKKYDLNDYIAGLITSLNKSYGREVSENVIGAEATIFRTYILAKTDYCKNALVLSTTFFENKYVVPDTKIVKTMKKSLGRVIVENLTTDGEKVRLLFESIPEKFKFSYTSYDTQSKDLSLNYTVFEYNNNLQYQFNRGQIYLNKDFQNLGTNMISNEVEYADSADTTNSIVGIALLKFVNIEKVAPKNVDFEQILLQYFSYYDVKIDRCGGYLVGNNFSSIAPINDNSIKVPSEFKERAKEIHEDIPNLSIYMDVGKNTGQCAWYAKWRAIEIVYYSDRPDRIDATNSLMKINGNGYSWYANPSNKFFAKSQDYTAVQAGTLIAWCGGKKEYITVKNEKGEEVYKLDENNNKIVDMTVGAFDYKQEYWPGYGHVAIIEEVLDDGKAVMISHGSSKIWNGGCSKGYACVNFTYERLLVSQIPKIWAGYSFVGYTYLLE